MKRFIHAAEVDTLTSDQALKVIGDELKKDGMGFSDDKTFAARITEDGNIEYVTKEAVDEALNDDPKYYSEDPMEIFYDCAELIQDKKEKADYAEEHGFLKEFASY